MFSGGNMSSRVGLYRPSSDVDIKLEDIPEWSEEFHVSRMQSNWFIGLVCNPKDREDEIVPAILDQRSQFCGTDSDPVTLQDIKDLWKENGMFMDGIFKRNGNFYFWRSGVNEYESNEMFCRSESNEILYGDYNQTEAVTLELWMGMSQNKGFGVCEISASGQREYKINFERSLFDIFGESEVYTRAKSGLNDLIKALEWQQDHPREIDNPFNPQNLPLEISYQKACELRDHINEKDRNKKISLGIGASLSAIGIALAFALTGRWFGGHGRPPSGPSGGGSGLTDADVGKVVAGVLNGLGIRFVPAEQEQGESAPVVEPEDSAEQSAKTAEEVTARSILEFYTGPDLKVLDSEGLVVNQPNIISDVSGNILVSPNSIFRPVPELVPNIRIMPVPELIPVPR